MSFDYEARETEHNRLPPELMKGGLNMKTIFGMLAVVVPMANPAAADKADNSANHYLLACRDFLKGHLQKNPFRQGQCAGIIEALDESAPFMPSGRAACTPDGVTVGQVVAVVVRWLENHPQRGDERFISLALLALHDEWPCK